MAYPIVPATYGFKPVNLIGGQVFAGSTRQLPIQYGYATNIFYGDVVATTRGFTVRTPVTTGASATTGGAGYGQVGIFLGCSYTDPTTKQKRFSQFWPANTLAGDAMAVVTDDPDTVFKAVSVQTTGTSSPVGSVATAMIGQNVQASDLAGNLNTGDSSNGILIASGTVASTSTFPFRIVDIVRDTAIPLGTATYTSGTTTLTISAAPAALPIGTEVGFLASNGQYIGTGSYVATAAAAGATSVVLNAQYGTVNTGGTASTAATIPAGATLVFTQYPEVLVKFNQGVHEYYNSTASQTA
jgi:hypothetical protein